MTLEESERLIELEAEEDDWDNGHLQLSINFWIRIDSMEIKTISTVIYWFHTIADLIIVDLSKVSWISCVTVTVVSMLSKLGEISHELKNYLGLSMVTLLVIS